MKENRRVSGMRPMSDDSARVVEVITNTAARAAAQQEWLPQMHERPMRDTPSAAVEAVLGLPVAEALSRRFRSGCRYGFIGGVVVTIIVLHELAMLIHMFR